MKNRLTQINKFAQENKVLSIGVIITALLVLAETICTILYLCNINRELNSQIVATIMPIGFAVMAVTLMLGYKGE